MPYFDKLEDFQQWLSTSNICLDKWENSTCAEFYQNLALNTSTCADFNKLVNTTLSSLNTENLNFINNALAPVINNLMVNISNTFLTDCPPNSAQNFCQDLAANTSHELMSSCLKLANHPSLGPQHTQPSLIPMIAFLSVLGSCMVFIILPMIFCYSKYQPSQETTIKVTPIEGNLPAALNGNNLQHTTGLVVATNEFTLQHLTDALNDSGFVTIDLEEETPPPIMHSHRGRNLQENNTQQRNLDNIPAPTANRTHTSLAAHMG